jgi:alanine dehydrogenase
MQRETDTGMRPRFVTGLERLSEAVTGFVGGYWGTLSARVLVGVGASVSLLDRQTLAERCCRKSHDSRFACLAVLDSALADEIHVIAANETV